jgi:hypothetical protein
MFHVKHALSKGDSMEDLTTATALFYRERARMAQRRIDQDIAIGRGACKHDVDLVIRYRALERATLAGGQSWPPAVRMVSAS